MESIRRNDSSHRLMDASMADLSEAVAGSAKLTASSSGSSQTSGHSSGTDCSTAAGAAAAAGPDPLAELLAQLSQQQQTQLQLQQQSAAQQQLLPPMDPAVILAAAANSNALFSNLALIATQLHQQQQQEQLQQELQQAAAAPAPTLFPPLGSLSQLGITGFPLPPPPSAFPAVSAFDPANAAALIAALTQQATTMQQQAPPLAAQQPRFDLGATDTTPLLNSVLSRLPISTTASSAFAPPPLSLASTLASAPFVLPSTSASLPPPIPTSVPNPFVYNLPSSMQTIVNPKPSMTVPPALRVKAVAARRRPFQPIPAAAASAAAAAAAAASTDDGMWSSGASTSTASNGGGRAAASEAAAGAFPPAPTASPDRYERPEGTRKRVTPSPPDAKKIVQVDNKFVMSVPLDMAMLAKVQGQAGAPAQDARRKVIEKRTMEVDEDDEIQVISQKINRRYRDHTKNVVYNVTVADHMKDMRTKGYLLNRHQATVLRLRYIAEHVIRSMNEFGWAVVDNYLGTDHVGHTANNAKPSSSSSSRTPTATAAKPGVVPPPAAAAAAANGAAAADPNRSPTPHYSVLKKEMEKLYEAGIFTAGQLMDNSDDEAEFMPPPRNEDDIKNVRSDYIYWYDGVDERATEAVTTRLLISMLDAMILHFDNRIDGKQIGGRSRAMLAIYPGGSTRYVKHVDNPNKDGRLITCIYYCNANWKLDQHGGALRLFPETSECAMDIDPQADRLVFFWSDRRNPHEVMPVYRHRFAITIWYMDKVERDAAQARKRARKAAAAAAAAAGIKREPLDDHTHDHDHEALRVMIDQPQLGALLQFGSMRPTHNSMPRMGDAGAAAAASAIGLGLPRPAAAIGRTASPRSRSDNNMARRFEVARSECTQDEVESDEEEINDFIPPNTGAMPDYEI
ncbi:hypothetical protein PFISCL1PPCAC_3550 [Pristionchus fissidentatus]|uniref:hypoxia-inducible factor-proline dioxygenase n=1 Tax=Pristionchus fissidentatus TaxID=1538716 RepID=A0AAV5V1E9_9BILA|nr:hypothetical protein PFISCL1PPCAC_3550 [Pristionchus fissidentatus]